MKTALILVLTVMPNILSAQFLTGLSIGANMSKFSGIAPPDVSYGLKSGLNFGGVIGYKINDDFTLILQPAYSQRGSAINIGEDTLLDSMRVYTVKSNFLTMPLIVRIDSDNRITYFISGIEFGIPLSSTIELDGNDKDISQGLKDIDVLATIGMGLRFSVGKPNLMIEIRYYQGLVNFNAGTETDHGRYFDNFKNTGIQITAGLEWEL